MRRSNLLPAIPALALACAPLLAACGAPLDGEEAVASDEAPLDATRPLPQGMVCGLAHLLSAVASDWGDPFCDHAAGFDIPPGYGRWFTGDFGMPARQGFYHDELFVSTPVAEQQGPARLRIPRGVACGFGHTVNRPHATCMGYNVTVSAPCPPGWTKRTAVDADSNGARWFWCEYSDYYALCPPGACLGNVPAGTVCGLSYSNQAGGICEGRVNAANGCPPGWAWNGPRDQGAPRGVGIAWCARNP